MCRMSNAIGGLDISGTTHVSVLACGMRLFVFIIRCEGNILFLNRMVDERRSMFFATY
jgi:hypothetical protein